MPSRTVKLFESTDTSGHRSRPETRITLEVVNNFERGFSQMVSKIKSQMSSSMRKHKIRNYAEYFYFTLIEAQDSWPRMGRDKKEALRAAIRLLSTSGSLPNYRGSIAIPDSATEKSVEKAVEDMAKWADSTFRRQMKSNYDKAIKRKVPEIKKIRRSDNLTDSVAVRFIDGLVRKWGLRDHPMWFSNPSRLRMILKLF